MVSGNITHLYGYVYETPEKKYELEIKFGENFPDKPPKFLYHDEVKELLGDIQLNKLRDWSPDLSIVDIVQELKEKIQDALQVPDKKSEDIEISSETEEYITPDLNAYPPDFEFDEYLTPPNSDKDIFYNKQLENTSFEKETFYSSETSKEELETTPKEPPFEGLILLYLY